MDIHTLGETGQCAFGAWLDRYGMKFLQKERYEEINASHAEFHKVAADVATKLKARDFDGARVAIAPNGALEQASGALADRLLQLKNTL